CDAGFFRFRHNRIQWRSVYGTETELVSEPFLACRTKLHRYYLFIRLRKQTRISCLFHLTQETRRDPFVKGAGRVWSVPGFQQRTELFVRHKLLIWLDIAHFKPSPK